MWMDGFMLAFRATKEDERARTIYKFALSALPRSKYQELYQADVAFLKQFGNED
jgi:hypothetical protein